MSDIEEVMQKKTKPLAEQSGSLKRKEDYSSSSSTSSSSSDSSGSDHTSDQRNDELNVKKLKKKMKSCSGARHNNIGDANITSSATTSSCINEFDYVQSTKGNDWKDLEDNPASKQFFIKSKKKPDEEFVLNIYRENYLQTLERIADRMRISRFKDVVFTYPLRRKDGTEKLVTVKYHPNQEIYEESLKSFYCQAITDSDLIVDDVKPGKKRASRPTEDRFSNLSKYHTADKSFYLNMISPSIADEFLKKSKYVRVLMGSVNCINLVSPCHFLCHVPGCNIFLQLKAFNDLTLVIMHWKKHAKSIAGKSSKRMFLKDASCVVLLSRHNFLKNRTARVNAEEVGELILEMEKKKSKSGQPYCIRELMVNKTIVEEGNEFKGSSFHTKLEIMRKISFHDPSALDDVPVPRTVASFFENKRRRSGAC